MRQKAKMTHCKQLSFDVNRISYKMYTHTVMRGHCGCDRMVAGFTTIYVISSYHH